MIHVFPSPTADTRTCDVATVTQQQLLDSSKQHIADVQRALAFFAAQITEAGIRHDDDKITDIAGFYRDFQTKFERTEWWDKHRRINRHHLLQEDGVPADVNLIDVLDFVADCVMAGMARSGSVYELKITGDLLLRAFQNTVELLKSQVVVNRACGQKHESTGAICSLPLGHVQNHRGDFLRGTAQWPKE